MTTATTTQNLCTALEIPVFLMTDLAFLKEYVILFEPIATAMTLLQGEKNCYLVYVLSMIQSVRTKISEANVRHAAALKRALLERIKRRFDAYFHDSEFLLATASHPMFKVMWTHDVQLKERSVTLLNTHVTSCNGDFDNLSGGSNADAAPVSKMPGEHDEDDVFLFPSTAKPEIKTVDDYLNDSDRSLDMLNRHPAMKHHFLQSNTVLPSSAPVERLFSSASLIITKRRNRLSDELFEKLLLLKQNSSISCDLQKSTSPSPNE